ncbi:MAG: hypothetical protein BRC31_04045 [Actinobacteria bacterium QS_5_72_10]|nr:MAG: hypothetical protein BRC31_04045 [Actinobacteria bacterium QS_5_72_10]
MRLGTGFHADERERILDVLRKLDQRLQRYDADAVDMELTVKDRETTKQKVTLELWIAKPRTDELVATSTETGLRDALNEVREDMWRQLDEMINRRIDARRAPTRSAPPRGVHPHAPRVMHPHA